MSPSHRRKLQVWAIVFPVAGALGVMAFLQPLLIVPVALAHAALFWIAGWSAVESVVVALIIGGLVFLLQPPVHVHHRPRGGRSDSTPPNPAPQRTPPAAARLVESKPARADRSAELWR
ncbi:hypothetical protein OJF2_41390 [Aquisphaera giovannonii]|uniref:Uncharacterized protein n=1 Tax=Aquisphaera giovannonii TaxID=406548 RepID=A0A5B9W4L4_9BACT|nr:hypothetical protein OJF2_41390 [Aquisphaera giovannonii]